MYAECGNIESAKYLFDRIPEPDVVSWNGMIGANVQHGQYDETLNLFHQVGRVEMKLNHFAIASGLRACASITDLEQGKQVHSHIIKDGLESGIFVGSALVDIIHGDIKLGNQIAEYLFHLEPLNVANHVLLSNIYAADGRWDDVAKVRKIMKDRGLKKEPGRSWIEVRNRVHSFLAGDRSHPKSEDVYSMLDKLAEKMEAAGYVPNTKFVLNDVEEVHG
eukprot:PITA_23956